ncbi:MAG: hypothetical protein RLY93_20190 [Sumerlaeia bacterium]
MSPNPAYPPPSYPSAPTQLRPPAPPPKKGMANSTKWVIAILTLAVVLPMAGAGVLAVVLLGFYFQMAPPDKVVSGEELSARHREKLVSLGLVRPGETIHYLAADEPRLEDGVYFFTDEDLVIYSELWTDDAEIRLALADIDDVTPYAEDWHSMTDVCVELPGTSDCYHFYLSTLEGGDKVFLRSLWDKVNGARAAREKAFQAELNSKIASAKEGPLAVEHVLASTSGTLDLESESEYPYTWRYTTKVTNRTETPLAIEKFELSVWRDNQWVVEMPRGEETWGPAEFAARFGPFSWADGMLLPGDTVTCEANWHGAMSPQPVHAKWDFWAAPPDGGERVHVEAPVLTPQLPVKVIAPEEFGRLPEGLAVAVSPPEPKAVYDYEDELYRWPHEITVTGGDRALRILEFGYFIWVAGEWRHLYPDRPRTAWHFAKDYSNPKARVAPGESYTDPNCWLSGEELIRDEIVVYFIGEDEHGNRFKGSAPLTAQDVMKQDGYYWAEAENE